MQIMTTHKYSFSTEAKPSSQMAAASALVVALLALPAYPLPTCTMQIYSDNNDEPGTCGIRPCKWALIKLASVPQLEEKHWGGLAEDNGMQFPPLLIIQHLDPMSTVQCPGMPT